MDDPQRIVDDPDAAPLARSLLASAAGDQPGPSRRAAVAKRLGIAAALVAGSGEVGAGASAAASAGALWWKVGLIVVALGGAITGGVVALRGPAGGEGAPTASIAARESAPARAAASEAPVPVLPAPIATAPSAPSPTETAPLPPAAPRQQQPPPPRAQPRPAPLPPPPAPPPPAPAAPPPEAAAPAPAAIDARRLAAEVAVLDRARAALRSGDTRTAAAALDEHARAFSDGALTAEAELVRIETLIRDGDADLARRRADAFLSRFPQSPLAKRLRSLVDRLPSAAKESP